MEAIRGKYYLIEIDKNVFYDFRGTRDDNVSIYIQFGNKHDLKTRRKAYGFICRKIKQLDGNIEFNQISVWDLNNGGGDVIKCIGKEPYTVTQALLGDSFGRYLGLLMGGNDNNMNVGPHVCKINDTSPVGISTNLTVGSPEFMVNNVDFGTSVTNNQFIAQESISFTTLIDFSASAAWLTNFFELAAIQTGSEVSGESVLWDGDISSDLAALTSNSNDYYGYY